MSRLFDGGRFRLALLGGAVGVLVLIILGSLVLSGQLPPRGLVSGDVRAGVVGLLPRQQVIFERIDGLDVVTVRTDARGHFTATVPPGYYYVDQAIPTCPRIGACDRKFFPLGTIAFTIAAGQHVELQLATCDGIWQCHGH
jgi:hypothetical protein